MYIYCITNTDKNITMTVTEEEFRRWETELTEDLAACLAPLAELEDPTDPGDDLDLAERADEDTIVDL